MTASIEGLQVREVQAVADSRLTNSLAVAALTLLLYDHLISLREEVELIWKRSRWRSILKLVYLWNRYFSAVALSVLTIWRFYEVKTNGMYLYGFRLVSGNDKRRNHNNSGLRVGLTRSRPLLYGLILLISAEIVAMMGVDVHLILTAGKDYFHLGPVLTGCYPYFVPRFLTFYLVPSLIVSVIMFAMTLYKCLTSFRMGLSSRMPIISLFLRDGVFWFVGVIVATVVTFMNWATMSRSARVELLNTPCVVMFSLIASKTLMNIRRITIQDVIDGSVAPSMPTLHLSAVVFDSIRPEESSSSDGPHENCRGYHL
ncbi:hypothetical protein Hypma_009766 [Hypsizygus marmoreus]|uniref:DUF6533 domain-containing protein n=1 Tax=Hypsizygus marmoreus TaxID=39966 RepID=A0A369JQZ0_HYPMA|nr:hypothetical protein Hypma_009766 [Hypsizygus marmoreus]